MKTSIIFLLSFIVVVASAQTGTIRGKITDRETGEELIGATVVISGTTSGAVTDFEGNYAITKVQPGTYNLDFSFVSYQKKTISDVAVTDGEATVINVALSTDTEELEAVIVEAKVIKDSEAALVAVKRKSANLLDGISSETFRKIGDSDAAGAIKRVSGVSVQGGKYVFVRGLGDRYTKTVLNGMEVPGLDPERNSIQMDLFPTNIVDNIIVKKSFTADLPADFTGGIVDVETKDFPEEKNISAALSFGYNPDMHFNSNYLSANKGNLDFLGIDDGTRDLPVSSQIDIPNGNASPRGSDGQKLREVTQRFDPAFGPTPETSFGNLSLSLSAGNQFNKEKVSIGINSALNYRNTTELYENAIDASIYEKNADPAVTELDIDRRRTGNISNNNVLLSGMLGLALKTKRSKISTSMLAIRNGEATANRIFEENFLQSVNQSDRFGSQYTERAITNNLLSGEHHLEELSQGLTVDWRLSSTISRIDDKDVRSVPFTIEEGAREIQPSEGGNPRRLWRSLDEVNYSGKVNITKKITLNGNDSKLGAGMLYSFKERDFSIERFEFNVANPDEITLSGDPNKLLTPENSYNDGTGTFVETGFEESNTYNGSMTTLGFYVSGELAFTPKFKAVLGVRLEKYVQTYLGGDQDYFNSGGDQGVFIDDEDILDTFNPFPTANLIYSLNENGNLRASYSRTVARPSFKEKSIAQIFDPLTNTAFIGNIDLTEADVDNFDLRYEYYFKGGQTVAFSTFYKSFTNPIEVTVVNQDTPDQFTAENNGDAIVYGIEIEAKKNLDFIAPALRNFSLNANISLVRSELEMDTVELAAKSQNLRVGEEMEDTRDMQGQSPYLINAGISYNNFDSGWEGGLFYNVQGPALARVGIGNIPDLYNDPFHSVNASIKKTFGPDDRASLQLRVSNLLNDKVETTFRSFEAADRISTSRAPGRTFTVRLGYTF